jgi:HSP90 family molecular chaperone
MYLTDVLDEYVMQQLTEFEDFKFANIAKEDVDTSAEAEGEVRHGVNKLVS